MRRIAIADLEAVAWKNRGGVTREIAGAADGDGLLWRLSLAQIDRDGPFSAFPGLGRILTVVAGDGLVLDLGQGGRDVAPLEPLEFEGEAPVSARLGGGPVQALNVIYRPQAIAARVEILHGDTARRIGADTVAIHALRGAMTLDGAALARGILAIGRGGGLRLSPGAVAVVVSLQTV